MITKDVEQRFKENMKYEYELLETFKPELLEETSEVVTKQRVFVDQARLAKEGRTYLEELQKQGLKVEKGERKSFKEYH